MNGERVPTGHEVEIPSELNFISPDGINVFRLNQDAELQAARQQAVDNTQGSQAEASSVADQQMRAQNDAACESYVAQYVNRDGNPALFDQFKQLVITNSIYNMHSVKWNYGDPDGDGNYTQPETSGRELLHNDVLSLVNNTPAPEDPPTPDTSEAEPTMDELRQNLVDAREAFAALSIERRRKLHNKGKSRERLEARFNEASQAYRAAFTTLAARYVTRGREHGADDAAQYALATQAVIAEHGHFTNAEKVVLGKDTTIRGRFAKFMAKSNKRFFASTVALGAVAGVGARLGTRSLGLAAGTALGIGTGIGIGVAMGVGTTRAALVSLIGNRAHLHTDQADHAAQDNESLQARLENVGQADTVETTYSRYINELHGVASERVGITQNNNRKRLGKAAIAGAIGGAIGVGVAEVGILTHGFGLGHHGVSGTHHTGSGSNDGSAAGNGPNGDGTSGMGNGHTSVTPSQAGYTDGFKDHINVEHGHGYTNELQDLAAQKHLHLAGPQAWTDYQQMADKFHGNLLTNDHSYVRSTGDYGISRPGYANWNPAAVHYFNHLLEAQIKAGTVTTA